nr:hypothetical protein [Brevibacterium aurantiacum]
MDTVIARLGKPHGIKGEFTVEVRTDRPDERLVPGQTYSTDPDIGELTLRTARWHRDRLLLTFDEGPRSQPGRGDPQYPDPQRPGGRRGRRRCLVS